MFDWFKPKKIHQIEYRDNWSDCHCVIIKATDPANAWIKLCRGHSIDSSYRPSYCISIRECET